MTTFYENTGNKSKVKYLSVKTLKDKKKIGFVCEVDKNEAGAIEMERENPTTKQTIKKWEKHFSKLEGKITNMFFEENEYTGKTLKIWIDNDCNLSLPVKLGNSNSPLFTDFANRLLNPKLNIKEKMSLVLYKILNEEKTKKDGVERFNKYLIIYQGDKIEGFYNKDNKDTNDHPKYDNEKREIEGKEYNEDYFKEVRKHYVNKIQEFINKNQNYFDELKNNRDNIDYGDREPDENDIFKTKSDPNEEYIEYEDVNLEDIPF